MESNNRKYGIDLEASNNSTILILGTLPGDDSIESKEYYKNKTNQFWDIISLVFEGKKIEFKSYDEKVEFLHKHCIALWDVYHSAERKGSADKNIKNSEFNNIKNFMDNHKNIEKILVNGNKAKDAFKKYLKEINEKYDYEYVPSSSRANTRYTVERKADLWKEAIFKR